MSSPDRELEVDDRPAGRPYRLLSVVLGIAVAAAAVWLLMRGGISRPPQPRVIVLYCFSVLDDVMEEALLPAFSARWQEQTGETVEFVTTYAGSGELVRRIIRRYPAEVAVFSSELDAYRLANFQLRWQSWRELPHRGILASTPLVIVVREGNPLGIEDFRDLAEPEREVILPDPESSGVASLSVLAVYASALGESDDPATGRRRLEAFRRNVVRQVASARAAHAEFDDGVGDAFITYEHDVIGNSQRSGVTGEIVYPPRTLLAEFVVAKIDKNIDVRQRRVVDAFVDFLWSPEAQELLVRYGMRSVEPDLEAYNPRLGTIRDSFTLDDLGGATRARREILEAVWQRSIAAQSAD